MTRISDALSSEIRRRGKPVISSFEIERLIYDLYQRGEYEGKSLLLRSQLPSSRIVASLKNALIDHSNRYSSAYRMVDPEDLDKISEELERFTRSTLISDKNFPASICRVSKIPDSTPEELCCIVDPWCFVSHLSAMQQWSLSNRNPVALYLTRPKSSLWREKAKAELLSVYAFLDLSEGFPHPRERVTFPKVLRRRTLTIYEPGYLGQYIQVPDSETRIATVGQTFRDMLHEPALCGGMGHVLDVWEKHAETYLNEIIETLNNPESRSTKISFVRAGYILADRLKISDSRIDAWEAYAERGGSRKLDPE